MITQADLTPTRDPIKFLGLLKHIAERVESGKTNSISIQECQNWGFERSEAIAYLLSLIEVGVLSARIKVYDEEDEMFVDFAGNDDLLSTYPENQIKV